MVILDVRACSLHLPTAHHARPGFCHGHIRRTSRLYVNWQYNGGWRISCGFDPPLRTGLLCLPSLLRNGVPLRTSGAMDSASGSLPTPWGCGQWSMLFVRCLDVLSSPDMMRGLSITRLPPCPISASTSGIWRHSRVGFNVRFNVVTIQPAVLVYSDGVAMDLCCMGYALDALSSLRDESALSRPSTTSPPLLRESRTQRHVTWSATQ